MSLVSGKFLNTSSSTSSNTSLASYQARTKMSSLTILLASVASFVCQFPMISDELLAVTNSFMSIVIIKESLLLWS